MDVRAVLADVAGLGPFFTVATDPAERVDPSWRPVAEMHTDPAPLRDRIAQVRRVLDSDDRVAASITFQGIAALLVSAPFAAVAVHGVLPVLTPTTLHWRASAAGPWPLWWAEPRSVRGGPDELGPELVGVIEGLVGPLVDAVRAQVPIAEGLLRGSVASSVASGKRLVGQQRPAAATRATRLAELLLDGPLAGTGDLLEPVAPDTGWTFRRRSCCLYYRVRDGGLCGDCVLHARPSVPT